MKIIIEVPGLPPKKDGANSMWRKDSELARLKALRKASAIAMKNQPRILRSAILTIHVYANAGKGDLDNFITGICDGLMAAQSQTPFDPDAWLDLPEEARPDRPICYIDDVVIQKISAERLAPMNNQESYKVELEGE